MNRLDVDAMLAEMDSDQFAEWVAYSEAEPWGEERADLRSAIIASEVCNTPPRFFGKNGKAKWSDFMPFRESQSQRQTPAELSLAMMTFAATFGLGLGQREAGAVTAG